MAVTGVTHTGAGATRAGATGAGATGAGATGAGATAGAGVGLFGAGSGLSTVGTVGAGAAAAATLPVGLEGTMEGANTSHDTIAIMSIRFQTLAAIRSMIVETVRNLVKDAKDTVKDQGEAGHKP